MGGPRGNVQSVKIATAAIVIALATSGCGLFTLREPYERWDARVNYVKQGEVVLLAPETLEVDGPRGAILVTNTTDTTRGFRIEGLGVAVEVDRSESQRVQVTGVQDGETYRFGDHLHSGEPSGRLVVNYVRRDR